jgi:hypothetical protein
MEYIILLSVTTSEHMKSFRKDKLDLMNTKKLWEFGYARKNLVTFRQGSYRGFIN